ncbi:Tektin-4 [Pseudolycoriella hygida]|uniref:Tektin n=1 Tax=Pseudolycoriella hygida TaxID=35572 RepID=A0A9Q0SAE9_9DIPT|nr:Tektin-4 [Pseudolycoriella hygida]
MSHILPDVVHSNEIQCHTHHHIHEHCHPSPINDCEEKPIIPTFPITNIAQSKKPKRIYALDTVPEPKYDCFDSSEKENIKECKGSVTEDNERLSPKDCPSELNNSLPFHRPGEPMGALGPWATGRVDWSPLAGLTGTRPVVDRYSITRFSTDEWKMRNLNLINKANDSLNQSLKTENDGKNVMSRTFSITDQAQEDNTKRLTNRTSDINICKNTLERAIGAQVDEITLLEDQRHRLKRSLAVLGMPERIAKECLDRRCGRSDTELVRDIPEEELVKEIALIAEIKNLLEKTLKDVEEQQIANRAARERLEFDWSDKKDAAEIDALNAGLNNKSTTILFKPGATRFLNEQSTEQYWKHFTEQNLEQCETSRQKSILLRQTLNAILMNAARDLRTQADAVERALQDRITATEVIREKLENDLTDVLRRLAETEKLIDSLADGMKSLDHCMKTAQTRLDNRNQYRYNVENCRDRSQYALVEEVKTVQDGVTAMEASIQEAENAKRHLMDTRNDLEREIILKRRSIMIDGERCLLLRTHFPSTTALSGNA